MTEPLPDLDIYTAATDPPAQHRYNELLIKQFRANAGTVTGQFANLPVLLLKTIGAKTGATRTAPPVYLKDGDRYLIIASKAGAPTNPAWYHNLVANPAASVELPNESFGCRPGSRKVMNGIGCFTKWWNTFRFTLATNRRQAGVFPSSC
jgi:deazaflavin-dependent oxidoreductase (nitroreductase family)